MSCALLIVAVLLLLRGATDFLIVYVLAFPVVVDLSLGLFFPSRSQHLVRRGCCPFCAADVGGIGVGEVYCPACGEILPAGLRRYG